MAKVKSIIKFVGTIKGITYYFLNGKYLSREANPPTKDQIKYDPRFATVKANTQEFGGASILSKAIRNGLGENEKLFKDNRFTSRLTGACRKIIQKGNGKSGERLASLANMPDALKGFQLQKHQIFNQIFATTPIITTDPNRQLITISIPRVNLTATKNNSKSSTHFKLIAVISLVAVHKWDRKTQKYQPTQTKLNGLGAMSSTAPLLLNKEHQNVSLIMANPIKQKRYPFPKIKFLSRTKPNRISITVWLGITFGSMEGTKYKIEKKTRAMECIAVL